MMKTPTVGSRINRRTLPPSSWRLCVRYGFQSYSSGCEESPDGSPSLSPDILRSALCGLRFPFSLPIREIGDGMRFVCMAVLKNSGKQLQDGRNRVHLKDLWVSLTSRWAYGRCSWMAIGVTLRIL